MSNPKRPEIDENDPAELQTENDDAPALSQHEAEVAGIVPGMVVYGDSSIDPNADDRRDNNRAEPDEHF